jgi:uncharacterized membrane protein
MRPLVSALSSNANAHLFNPEWSIAMKRIYLRKTLNAAALAGGTIVSASALSQSQGSYGPGSGMMGGYGSNWMGGYGGMWLPILVVVVVVGLVAWVVAQKRK